MNARQYDEEPVVIPIDRPRRQPRRQQKQEEPVPDTRLYSLLDDTELENMPPVKFLDDDLMIPEKGMTLIYGDYANGKSFLALHKAYEISIARDAYAVYIVAEGKHGVGQRIRAIKAHLNITGPTKVKVIDVPVLFMNNDGEVQTLIRTLRGLPEPPLLMVVDTLARCMIGGDENSTKDMSTFVENVDMVRREFDSMSAIIVHHKPKGNNTSRGSVALPGACDRAIEVSKKDMDVTVHCDKSKDTADFQDMFFALTPVEHTPSCVLVKQDAPPPDTVQLKAKVSREQVLEYLPQTGATHRDWLSACTEAGMKPETARKAIPATKVGQKTKLVNGLYVLNVNPTRDLCPRCMGSSWLALPTLDTHICTACYPDEVLKK